MTNPFHFYVPPFWCTWLHHGNPGIPLAYNFSEECWIQVRSRNHIIVLPIMLLYIIFIFFIINYYFRYLFLSFGGIFLLNAGTSHPSSVLILWCNQCPFLAPSIHCKPYLSASVTCLLFPCLLRGLYTVCICVIISIHVLECCHE